MNLVKERRMRREEGGVYNGPQKKKREREDVVNFDGLLNSETRWRARAVIPHRRVGRRSPPVKFVTSPTGYLLR